MEAREGWARAQAGKHAARAGRRPCDGGNRIVARARDAALGALCALALTGVLPALGAAGLEWLLGPVPAWARLALLVPATVAGLVALVAL